ncbi:MAG TPA: hypothetical protein VJN91_07575 [Gammaproteobacteria bacterium]|nr:hypothetical protein [Gammaproteobacteria bacterium]
MILLLVITGCGTPRSMEDSPQADRFRLYSLGKSDMNQVMEINVCKTRAYLRELMEKLYKRNPRELAKSPHPDVNDSINRIFSLTSDWHFQELNGVSGSKAIELSSEMDALPQIQPQSFV